VSLDVSERVGVRRRSRLPTGIEALDRVFGGIPSGSVILISGKPGSGFDIFAQQMLYFAAYSGACNVLYVTADHPTYDVESEMIERGWAIDTLLSNNRWVFLDAYSVRSNVIKHVGGAKALTELFRSLPSLIKEGTWLAVDTLTSFLEIIRYEDALEILVDLMSCVREKGGLHLLLIVEGLHDEKTVTTLMQMADGFINFTLDSRYAEPVGRITIGKLRMLNHVRRVIPYRIVENGILIETTTRIS